LDYSVGLYMKEAKKEPYYKNTIFVFYGDHGISGNAGEHVTPGESSGRLGLGSLRVPFIIYSPFIKTPKVFKKVMSETDVMATIASLAGISYIATTIGRDIFDKRFDNTRYAFTMRHIVNPRIGLIGDKYYFRTRYDGTQAGLYDIYSTDPLTDHAKEHPKLFKKMHDITYGLYESAKYIPYFNKRD